MTFDVKFNPSAFNIGGDFQFESEDSDTVDVEFRDITIATYSDKAVLYEPQTLDEEQQAQARENIGIKEYELPIASEEELGGVKIGEGLSIDENGILNSDAIDDKNYVFNQLSANDIWEVNHNLNKFPSATIVDSAGSVVMGNITYIDLNNLVINFNSPFSGTAYLN